MSTNQLLTLSVLVYLLTLGTFIMVIIIIIIIRLFSSLSSACQYSSWSFPATLAYSFGGKRERRGREREGGEREGGRERTHN